MTWVNRFQKPKQVQTAANSRSRLMVFAESANFRDLAVDESRICEIYFSYTS